MNPDWDWEGEQLRLSVLSADVAVEFCSVVKHSPRGRSIILSYSPPWASMVYELCSFKLEKCTVQGLRNFMILLRKSLCEMYVSEVLFYRAPAVSVPSFLYPLSNKL